MRASRLLPLCCVVLALSACRDHRQLELFPKAQSVKATPCGTGMACPAHAPICVDGACVECSADAECKKDKPICMAARCVQCATELDCPADQACNVGIARCTKRCAAAADCKEKDRTFCNALLGYCVMCTTDSECKGPKASCDINSGSCVDCAMPEPCPECVTEVSCARDAGVCAPGAECMVAPPPP